MKIYKWLGWILIVLTIFVLIFLFLFEFAGLKQYFKAVNVINKMQTGTKKDTAVNNFYGDYVNTSPERTYGGILARIGKKGIWIWGEEGLKYFSVDGEAEYPVYQIIDDCQSILRDKEGVVIVALRTSDFSEWAGKAKVGDNVVVLSKSEIGKYEGSINSDVQSFNWWHYLEPKLGCEN